MKSPFTGKEMELNKEKRMLEFRKEKYPIIFHFYRCADTGEQLTDAQLDEVNINQLYNQYRDKYNIPFTDEIAAIRKKYQLSYTKMSEILGLGVNSYRLYENGEMPSLSNAKLIQMAKDPRKFKDLVEMCDTLEAKEKEEILEIVAGEIKREADPFIDYLMGDSFPDVFSGYRSPDFEKAVNMILFFAKKLNPFKTKMNKLLFYADFEMYRATGFSISGLRYYAINRGPVPDRFQSLYDYLEEKGYIQMQLTDFGDFYGERISNVKSFNAKLFTDKENQILKKVAKQFHHSSSRSISDISHEESAWTENMEGKKKISYNHAFELKMK